MVESYGPERPAGNEDWFAAPEEAPGRFRRSSRFSRPELDLADLIAADQQVPVPIDSLLQQWADVIDVDLPADLQDVDAVSISYPGGKRSRVLINRAKSATSRRERFTKAHELGHLVIPWHVGSIGCTTQVGATGGDAWTAQREAEANRFAARLLVPQHWLLNEVITREPLELFAALDSAEVSVLPALLRLVPELPFGWMIAIGGDNPRVLRSPGSFMPPVNPLRAAVERRSADRAGRSNLGGRTVRWWVWDLIPPPYPELPLLTGRLRRPPNEVREDQLRTKATELLRQALAESGRQEDDIPHFAGVTGAIDQNATIRSPEALYSALRQRFSDPATEGEIVFNPVFVSYLAVKSWQYSDVAAQEVFGDSSPMPSSGE